jgi:cytochrome P450
VSTETGSPGEIALDADDLTPLVEITTSPDPREAYERLRREWGPVAPVELEPGVNAWLVMGWEEICHVVRRERLFSRNPRNWRAWQEKTVAPDSGLGPMMFPRDNAYFFDGVDHHRLRAPLDDGIAHIDQRGMRRSVNRMCADLIAGFAPRGSADLVAEYAAVIPMLAVANLFGLDADRGHELQRALIALFGSGEDSQAGNRKFEEIIGGCMHSHRQAPADDLTSIFIDHPNLHDDGEVAQSMVLMISAGYETTTTWIAQSLRLMLTDARFLGRLGGWRPGVDDALDEVLWRDPPMANMPARYAMRDTELADRRIQRGDALILALSAANNDSRVHVRDPWTELGNRSHLAWSAGPHACPAVIPARIITRAAVDTLLGQLPGVRLAVPPEQIAPRPSPWTRCPASLPVLFSPQSALVPGLVTQSSVAREQDGAE